MKKSIQQLFNLSGKVAIVTGGAMGIGKGIALKLAEAGASVLIADIVTEKEARETLDEIDYLGGKSSYIQIDLSSIKNLPQVTLKAIAVFGDLHILVNNAGIYKYAEVTALSEELWDKTINLNLKSVAFLSKLAVNAMIANNHGGKIINISSVDSIKPSGNLSHYDASKGGLRMLTRSFAKEVSKYGILVNEIAPGGIRTPGIEKISGDNPTQEQKEALKTQFEQFEKSLPLQRLGEPEDIGNAALFLASDASNYMTGSTMIVDGGLLLM